MKTCILEFGIFKLTNMQFRVWNFGSLNLLVFLKGGTLRGRRQTIVGGQNILRFSPFLAFCPKIAASPRKTSPTNFLRGDAGKMALEKFALKYILSTLGGGGFWRVLKNF